MFAESKLKVTSLYQFPNEFIESDSCVLQCCWGQGTGGFEIPQVIYDFRIVFTIIWMDSVAGNDLH